MAKEKTKETLLALLVVQCRLMAKSMVISGRKKGLLGRNMLAIRPRFKVT